MKKIIAAFDFDGTITYRDSFFPFLLFNKGIFKTIFLLISSIPVLAAFLLGKANRQDVKESLLSHFFKGESLKCFNELGEIFAKTYLPKHIKPEALARIRWHQKQGHRCIIISASLETYLQPWAKANEFHDVLASRAALDENQKITGALEGLNCRGPEKVRRLQALLGPLDNYEIYAYGDSKGDQELLDAADHPYYRNMPTSA